MSESSNGHGEVIANPMFTLRSLEEARHRLPPEVWEKYHHGMHGQHRRTVLKKLHAGSQVKVMVDAVASVAAPEMLWLEIVQMDHVTKHHIGKVRNYPARSQHHGLEYGMMITFETKHIFDVLLHRLS